METQTCGHCRQEKELSDYPPSYRGRPGTWCRACNRARYIPKPRPPRPEVPEGHAHCGRCDTVKPLAEFYHLKVKNWCKLCYREWHRGRYIPKDGATDAPRDCAKCGKTYCPKQRRPSTYCSRSCKDEATKETGAWRARYLEREYGITEADYDRMLAEQGGGCALCGVKPEDLTAGRYRKFLHVDHDHDTGQIRGLLCPDHNLLLGRFGDSSEMFRRIVDYLEGHRDDASRSAAVRPGDPDG